MLASPRHRCARFLLLGFLAPLAAACGSDASSSAPAIAVVSDSVGGVERLTYAPDRMAELPWRLDTTAVIGGFTVDDPNYQFGSLGTESLAADAAGNLYVLDVDGIRVLGYSPHGEFLGSWGREGGGPGELGGGFGGGPRAMVMGPGDTLWIGDRANQRLTLIPIAGGEPTSVPLPQSNIGLGGTMAIDGGGLIALLSTFSFSPGETDQMPPRPLVRIGRDGEAADTLALAPAPKTDLVTITTSGNSLMMMMSQVFAPGFRWARFSDGGLVTQEAAAYELVYQDGSGSTQRIVRRDPAPRPVTEVDRQTYLDSLLAPPDEESQFDTAEIRQKRAEATTFADLVPRIVELRRDTRDRLWVGVSEDTPLELERIDVFDRDGNLLGELRGMPMPDLFFGDGYAAIIDADDLDVQQVHIMRLVERPDALESAGM